MKYTKFIRMVQAFKKILPEIAFTALISCSCLFFCCLFLWSPSAEHAEAFQPVADSYSFSGISSPKLEFVYEEHLPSASQKAYKAYLQAFEKKNGHTAADSSVGTDFLLKI